MAAALAFQSALIGCALEDTNNNDTCPVYAKTESSGKAITFNNDVYEIAQSVKVTSPVKVTKLYAGLSRTGYPNGVLTVKIEGDTTNVEGAGAPNGTVLATASYTVTSNLTVINSQIVAVDTNLKTEVTSIPLDLLDPNPPAENPTKAADLTLDPNKIYWIRAYFVYSDNTTDGNDVNWAANNTNEYAPGYAMLKSLTGRWTRTDLETRDLLFMLCKPIS